VGLFLLHRFPFGGVQGKCLPQPSDASSGVRERRLSRLPDQASKPLHMLEAFPEYSGHMIIANGIQDVLAFLSELDKSAISKDPQLM
jgi:hypothetical protein